MSKYFCILGGGGVRGAAYTGVLRALDELNIEVTGFAGSSIGAVVAGLVTFGCNRDEVQEVFNNINFEFFKDINLNFGKDFALSKGGNFYDWIKNKIESKFYGENYVEGRMNPVKFKDLEKELVIFSVDLSTSKYHEFSKAKTPEAEIAQAIRVSVAMPGLYAPVLGESECLVDGDLIKSMPLWKASDTINNRKERILEFRLEGNVERKKISNTFEYLNAVYDSVSGFATDFVIDTYKNCDKYDFVKLNMDGISVVDFMVSKDKKREMANVGYDITMDYFNGFYKEKKKKLNTLYFDISQRLKKVLFYLKSKNFAEARFELADILASNINEKEILEKDLFNKLFEFKKFFENNLIKKDGIFFKKLSVLDFQAIMKKADEIYQEFLNHAEEFK